jgi:L-alanine-DL-glutamate epimerase-like enolase superfamily enzyme
VCLDQDIFTCKDIREMMNLGTGQGVNLKLMKFSDPFKLVEAANLTNDLGLNINLSGKIAETGIASSVLLNCAAVAPNINWGVSTTNQYLLQDIITKTDSSNFEPVTVDEYLVKQFKYTDV